jgi:aminotransferase
MPDVSRVAADSQQAMSIKFNTMVYELQQRGQKVLIMSLGEAYFDIPLFPMDDLPYPNINHYSHSRGLPELRQKLQEYFASEYDFQFDDKTEILITAGSKVAIYMALLSIVNPGDEVLYSEPAWVSYPEQIKLCYGIPVGIPCDRPLKDFEEYITTRTKAIIINNPHNPRGCVLRESDLVALLALAEKHDLWLLCDEAYSDFLSDGSFVSLGSIDRQKRRAVVFNSMSKNYGVSGWRIGYVIAKAAFIDNILKVNQHLITCPATILQYYLAHHFHELLETTKPQIRDVVSKRNRLAEYMTEIGLSYLPGTATFYFFVSIRPSRLTSEEFCMRLLHEELISVVPGVGYGETCSDFIRVSVGTASVDENMYGLRKIKELIDKTS